MRKTPTVTAAVRLQPDTERADPKSAEPDLSAARELRPEANARRHGEVYR